MGVYQKVKGWLEQGKVARTLALGEGERETVNELSLLTMKPTFYVVNVDEEELKTRRYTSMVEQISSQDNAGMVSICGDLESEIALLESKQEKEEFMNDLGLEESGLSKLVKVGYRMLNLITFYTTVGPELRAWTVLEGTRAPQAAGKIHTDMERGFIKAEVVSYNDFIEAGSLSEARDTGHLRPEGKEYSVQDGDIIHFRFSQ